MLRSSVLPLVALLQLQLAVQKAQALPRRAKNAGDAAPNMQ